MVEIRDILKTYWGYSSFREGQESAIRSVLDGRDTLLLLPTGGGKSVCFQVPALALGKLCIVVTPLIALMKDQVDQLRKRGIAATAVHSGMTSREIDIALDNCVYGRIAFLYVSPERLATEMMIARAKKMNVGLLAIDEAHCISQWGYDFRPAYLEIPNFREILPGVPVIALTASATEEVQSDIIDKLAMTDAQVFRRTFARANLSYSVFKTDRKDTRLQELIKAVPGTAIVYVRTRKHAVQIADWLNKQNIAASAYHAGLPSELRNQRQQDWISGKTRVIAATNAFGMGIDKADVRMVVHWDLPETLEAYYQEAGRAGRDGLKSYAVALYNDADLILLTKQVEQNYPPADLVRRVYQALANHFQVPAGSGQYSSFDFDLDKFASTFGFSRSEAYYSIRFLEKEGFILSSDPTESTSRIHMITSKTELYDFQLRNFNYDRFIKRILRFYGGEVFNQYVSVSEETLAKSLDCPAAEVVKGLEFLATRDVIEYDKRRETPQIQFLTDRFDAGRLPIREAEVKKRKDKDIYRANAVVDYASHPAQCRSILLLQYFNERETDYCGICDHCVARKKNETARLEQSETEKIMSVIRVYLMEHKSAAPNDLRNLFQEVSVPGFAAALHRLVEKEELVYDRSGNLSLKNQR